MRAAQESSIAWDHSRVQKGYLMLASNIHKYGLNPHTAILYRWKTTSEKSKGRPQVLLVYVDPMEIRRTVLAKLREGSWLELNVKVIRQNGSSNMVLNDAQSEFSTPPQRYRLASENPFPILINAEFPSWLSLNRNQKVIAILQRTGSIE